MKAILKLFFVAPLFWGMACASDDEPKTMADAKPIVLKSEFNAKMQANNAFALNLFKTTIGYADDANVFISPLSTDMALSMAWNGAAGETKSEMQTMLGNAGYTPEQINEYSKTLRTALLSVDPSTKLLIANSIWSRKDNPLSTAFVDVNKNNFNATVEEVDFSSPTTLTRINDWCAVNTNNKIPQALSELSSNTQFCLINALYFKGIWRSRFDVKKTTDTSFSNEDGTKSTVKMMNKKGDFAYNDNENWRCLSMAYGNNAFSMIVLLPQEGKQLADVVSALDGDELGELVNRSSVCDVTVKLPRFRGEYSYLLHKNILPSLGMTQAFSASSADFSNMSSSSKLYISQVIHKTFVEVNEEGTEAAAVTVVTGDLTAPPAGTHIDFFVDQPFVYAIRENSTGTILFIGKVGKL